MKGKLLCLSAAVLAAVAGCSTTPDPAPEPLKVNAVYQERCYSMDKVDQEVAGRAYLEKGQQFYYQLDCSKYVELANTDQAAATDSAVESASNTVAGEAGSDTAGKADVKTGSSGEGVAGSNADAAGAVSATAASSTVGSATVDVGSAEARARLAKEPTCYFDKETAGRGDLPPCPWDEEKQDYIK